jgi:hypothetical protein
MKWPEKSPVPDQVRQALEGRITEFLSLEGPEDSDSQGAAVRLLIDDLYLIYKGITPNTLEAAAALKELEGKGSAWDTDEPEFAQAQKLINRFMNGELIGAGDYAERLLEHKAGEGKRIKREIAVQNAAKKNAGKVELKRKAVEEYRLTRANWKTKKAAARELEQRYPGLSFSTIYDALKGL